MAEKDNPQGPQSDLERAKKILAVRERMFAAINERFIKNLTVLREYEPALALRFKNYAPTKRLEFFCLENGIPNLMVGESKDFFYKTEDPFAFCKAQVDDLLKNQAIKQVRYQKEPDPFGQVFLRYFNAAVDIAGKACHQSVTPAEIGSIPNCVMLGAGLGYQLGFLYEKAEVLNMVIVEPDPDLFFASLHTFDWWNLLPFLKENGNKIKFFVDLKAEDLFLSLNEYYAAAGKFISSSWWNFVHYASPEIAACARVLSSDNYLNYAAMGYLDDHLFGLSQALQNIKNGRHFVRGDVTLPKDMAEVPVFVVGSGPSLDADIPFLRKNQDRALIMACGTAFDTLYHAGIQPDFYGCTERTPQIAQTVAAMADQEYVKNAILVSGDVVHPDTAELFNDTALFMKPDEPLFWLSLSYLKDKLNKLKPIYCMNPLVGNLGVSSMLTLGFKNLFFFGLDNGRKEGAPENMHSKYTQLYNALPGSDKRGNYAVKDVAEGNFSGKVLSQHFYKLSVRHIEEAIRNHPEARCVNCSDGALIRGAEPQHSADLQFEKLPVLDKKRLKEFIRGKLTMAVPYPEKELEKALDPGTFNALSDGLDGIVSGEQTTRCDTVKALFKACEEIEKIRGTADAFLGNLEDGSMQSFFMNILNVLYAGKDEQVCLLNAKKIVTLFRRFLKDTTPLFGALPYYVIGPHQKYLGKTVGSDFPDCRAPMVPSIKVLVDKDRYKDAQIKFCKQYE